jgi:hypothetical protein
MFRKIGNFEKLPFRKLVTLALSWVPHKIGAGFLNFRRRRESLDNIEGR